MSPRDHEQLRDGRDRINARPARGLERERPGRWPRITRVRPARGAGAPFSSETVLRGCPKWSRLEMPIRDADASRFVPASLGER
jgi:hypothetical protein